MISSDPRVQTIQHGGNLTEAIKQYNITKENWLDLSTGISPWTYPFQPLPDRVWQELPPSGSELLASAAKFYDVKQNSITATPGSQIAIRLLPQLFEPSKVAIPTLGYKEHAASWQMANHQTLHYHDATELLELINTNRVEHVVVINPNNPNGEKLNLRTLDRIILKISGICIIDEAFIDYYDDDFDEGDDSTSISSATKVLSDFEYDNLIILRSVGKFFGLAGIRLGFCIGFHPSLQTLNALLQPWSISHASQYIGIQALQDKQWQQQQRVKIKQHQNAFQMALNDLLNQHLEQHTSAEAGLFTTVFADDTALNKLHHQLAKQGILTRLDNDQQSWLRFGLPLNIAEFEERILRFDSF